METSKTEFWGSLILAVLMLGVIAATGVWGYQALKGLKIKAPAKAETMAVWVEVAPSLFKAEIPTGYTGPGVMCYRLKDGDGMTSLACVKL